MTQSHLTRREALQNGGISLAAALAWMSAPGFAFPSQETEWDVIPFLNTPRAVPNRLDYEMLTEWLTPQDQVFSVQHYGVPTVELPTYKLDIGGLVEQPKSFTLEELKALPKSDQLMTLECSGNGSSPGFSDAVYNSKWTGTLLAPLLKACGVKPNVKEVVFYGADKSEETLRPGTKRELKVEVPFGRSLSLEDALSLNALIAYERNGEPLTVGNGAPVRLIVPGWYGIANVKWLTRIECRSTRYMGRYMARDYVTVRGEKQGDEIVNVESSVSKMNVKSVVARCLRDKAVNGQVPVKAYGAAWDDGTGISKVELQVDGGEWKEATLASEPRAQFSWTFFSIDLGQLAPGKHTIVSRAIDKNGRVQPAAEDDEIALKKTYWEAYQQWVREFEIEV